MNLKKVNELGHVCLKGKSLCLEQPAASTSIWYQRNCPQSYQPQQPAKTHLNSSFPMPHSLPTSHWGHPQGHFSFSCMAPVTLSSFCWPPTCTSGSTPRPQSPPLSHREGWTEHTLSAAWFSSHRWDSGTWVFRNLCCDLCSTSLQQKLTVHWLGVPGTCGARSGKTSRWGCLHLAYNTYLS